MATVQEVIEIINEGKTKPFKTAVDGESWSQDDVDAIWTAASATFKKALVNHAFTLNPSQDAMGQSFIVMLQNKKDALLLPLLESFTDVNWQDEQGRTLLSHAAEQNRQKTIDALLQSKADATLNDKNGFPPIYYAMKERKKKLAEQLLEYGVTFEADSASKLIAAAPSKEIGKRLAQAYLKQRTSSMTREQFVEKWGEPKVEHDKMIWPEVMDTNERFMKGEMYTIGYIHSSVTDPLNQKDYDWEAIDAAKSLAEQIATTLKEGNCYGLSSSEGDMSFVPFFMPGLGAMPGTDDFDARMSSESLATGSGAYDKFIRSHDTEGGGFRSSQIKEYFEDDSMDQKQYDAYMAVRELFLKNCSDVKEYRLYSDLVSFPVVIGGLDKYYNFVGVIWECVWT